MIATVSQHMLSFDCVPGRCDVAIQAVGHFVGGRQPVKQASPNRIGVSWHTKGFFDSVNLSFARIVPCFQFHILCVIGAWPRLSHVVLFKFLVFATSLVRSLRDTGRYRRFGYMLGKINCSFPFAIHFLFRFVDFAGLTAVRQFWLIPKDRLVERLQMFRKFFDSCCIRSLSDQSVRIQICRQTVAIHIYATCERRFWLMSAAMTNAIYLALYC